MIGYLWVFPMAVLVVLAWFFACNDRTLKDRLALIDARRDAADYWAAAAAFDRVSYNRHLWARFLCRDPMKLYPPAALQSHEGRK